MCSQKMSQEVSPLGSFFNRIFIIFLNFQRMMTRFLLPNLTLPAEEETDYIGVWGQRRLNYLKHHRKVLYYNLLISGKLHSHLPDIEEQAQQLFSRLVKQYAEKEGVTEELKATDQMKWVQKMNNIRERVIEVVNAEVVFV